MLPEGQIPDVVAAIVERGADNQPFLWRTDEATYGPFLARQAPARLLAIDRRTTEALLTKMHPDFRVIFPAEVSDQDLVSAMGNVIHTY